MYIESCLALPAISNENDPRTTTVGVEVRTERATVDGWQLGHSPLQHFRQLGHLLLAESKYHKIY